MKPSPWYHLPQPVAAPKARLLCCAFAGGSAAAFRPWAALVPSDIELVAVQLPGRMERYREGALSDLGAIVEALGQALSPDLFDRPWAAFGHSMGALLSFELARWARRRGLRQPLHLFLSSTLPPLSANRSRGLSKLTPPALVEALKSMGGLPEAFLQDRDLLDFFLPTLRADLTAFETWAPAPEAPVEIPLTVLGGLHDAHPLAHRLGEWAPETTATCEVRTFPGGHFYLQDRATEIMALLEQTLRPRLL